MPDPIRHHQKSTEQLPAVPQLGLPPAGLCVVFSEDRAVVEAGYMWMGKKRQPSAKTIAHADGDLNVDLDANGNFIGLEMLRMITSAEAKRFYRWAHRRWDAPKGKPHWPCSALMTLQDAWQDAEVRICPGCREHRKLREVTERKQWTPELAMQ